MKVWKSPVLYLGLLLIAAVLAALLAPFFIDWNSYRADLESYGRKLTGRAVSIEGPISARLFPWPRLIAEDVHLANLPGLQDRDFATAARIDVRMQLQGLLSGTIQVESVDILHPALVFERNSAGQGSWELAPAADVGSTDLLGRVRLDQITLRGGTLKLADPRRGGAIELTGLDASLAAPGIRGPWRMRARALTGESPLDLAINTGSYRPGEPLRFGVRVAPGDGSGLVYSMDGTHSGGQVKGSVRIEPAATEQGKSDAEGQIRPMVMTARIDGNFDTVALDDIQVTLQNSTDGGPLLGGSARIELGSHIAASAALEAPRLDLDEIAGAKSLALLREGQGLALANTALSLIPAGMSIDGTLAITSLKAGGENLDNVEIGLSGDREAIRFKRVHAGLPGRSEILFENGLFLPGDAGAELAGSLAVESNDFRQLTGWLWPEGKEALGKLWAGSRGRLKLQSDLSVKPGRLRLSKAQYELDGQPGAIDLTINGGERPSVDLRIDAQTLDIDNLAGHGLTALPGNDGPGIGGLLSYLLPAKAAGDLRLTVQAGKLLLNGIEADDIAVDLASGANGLDLRTVQIGSVGGARLDATGLVLDNGKGNDGSVDLTVAAEDPRGLLRLFGLLPAGEEPRWMAALGKTAIEAKLTVKPGGEAPKADVQVDGSTGDLALSASGSVSGGPALNTLDFKGAVDIRAGKAESLAGLAGFVPVGSDQSPAHLVLTGSGSLAQGFLADLQVEAFGANFEYNGSVAAGAKLAGKVSVRSTNATPLFAALGLPSQVLPSGVMVLDGEFANQDQAAASASFAGRLGDQPVSGKFQADGQGRITGNVETGPLSLSDVLAASLLAWNGEPGDSGTPFAEALPFGLEGELWIAPKSLAINDAFKTRDVQLALTAAGGEIHLELYGKDESGRDARIRVTSKPSGEAGGRILDGKVTLPVDLGQQLRLAGGAAVAEGSGAIDVAFTGTGRSPGGALETLAGSGSYTIKDFKLLDINPAAFKQTLGTASDPAAITAAFDALRHGGGLGFGDVSGSVTIEHGVAALLPFSLKTPDANATVKVLAELDQGKIDAAIGLTFNDVVQRPSMEISYAGPPLELARGEDKTELFGQLGVSMMDKGVAELERLRQEQERLAAEEETARAADEAKLQDYYAQRDEVRLRQRELKVHAVVRVQEAEALRQQLEADRAANAEINKEEMRLRARELRVYRKLAKAAEADSAMPPPPKPRSKPPQSITDILSEPLPLPNWQQGGTGPVAPSQ